MANRHDIMHCFANKQEGKNGTLTAGNVRYEGRNYYSYSTVFGQWLDVEKKVVAIFDGSTSNSSSKHKLYSGVFPGDVNVFPLDLSGSSWNHCNLIGKYANKDSDFKLEHRMVMINHYIGRIYDQLAAINGGKCKGLENVDFSAWGYVEKLCSLYKDTSIAKYLKWTENEDYKKLVKILKSGTREVPYLVDQLFGRGTWMQYWDYCARFRKSADKRARVEALCKRLNIRSPYEKWGGNDVLDHKMSATDIRKMTAKERLDIHFKALEYKERKEHEEERKKKHNKNFRNAYKWIVGYEPDKNYWIGDYENNVRKCRNMFTGEEYNPTSNIIFGFWWCKTDVSFNYDSFRKAEDKKAWIENFYAEVAEVRNNRFAISILRDLHHGTFEGDKLIGYYQTIYKAGLDEEELNVCMEFIRKCKAHYADEEARKRAEEIVRIKREEEERKEREHLAQVKQEQIMECLNDGIEGARNLWRKHLMSFDDARWEANGIADIADFLNEGNVLLRLNLAGDKIETSKNIRIPVEIAKKFWTIVQRWHEKPETFSPKEIDTKGSGKYTISSYENDILTAGCHKISYTEMENVMSMLN